ncbi:MAG: hypothetical protein C7B45_13710 [Sulfobacillus acidophilus]|uniref:Uncharacterized protein n=1 Tax=Sulfobacillus acidophilus TaxID=53633 RepID=A0A2T2WEM0_9FIRM|nr:MAG: hypothetical protein C7B45_13710 [Sulfobacillus acidophilus]
MKILQPRVLLAMLLLGSVLIGTAIHPTATREAAQYAVTLWWNHLVPILLPGYVLAQAALALVPNPPWYAWMILALLTFPPVVGLVALDLARQKKIPDDALAPILLYTNIYNPLLFPDPRFGLWLDGGLLAAAFVWHAPQHRHHVIAMPLIPLRPRQWIIDAMNWTSIVGFIAIMAWVAHGWLPPVRLGWLLDPLTMAWANPKATWWQLWWTACGGLAYWAPLLCGRALTFHVRRRLIGSRLLQAITALCLLALFSHWIR